MSESDEDLRFRNADRIGMRFVYAVIAAILMLSFIAIAYSKKPPPRAYSPGMEMTPDEARFYADEMQERERNANITPITPARPLESSLPVPVVRKPAITDKPMRSRLKLPPVIESKLKKIETWESLSANLRHDAIIGVHLTLMKYGSLLVEDADFFNRSCANDFETLSTAVNSNKDLVVELNSWDLERRDFPQSARDSHECNWAHIFEILGVEDSTEGKIVHVRDSVLADVHDVELHCPNGTAKGMTTGRHIVAIGNRPAKGAVDEFKWKITLCHAIEQK